MHRFRIHDLGFKNGIFSILILTTYFLLPTSGIAYTSPGNPSGHVNDFAHLLRPETVSQLETTLRDFETSTGNEIAVVTIDTHGDDETIETYAEKLFQEWGIGKEKEDNGLLLLVARDDREMRIEVGYGLEPIITDIESGRIISDVLTPAFREGNYDAGVTAALNRIMDDIGRGEPQVKSESSSSGFSELIYPIFFVLIYGSSILARSKSWWAGGVIGGIIGVVGIAIFSLSILYFGLFVGLGLLFDFLVSRTYKKSKDLGLNPPWWIGGGHGGSGGGGFGGFGGGMSGGGGASGRW